MNLNDLASATLRIGYADVARMKRIRAWARKNKATLAIERYAREAYSGTIYIHSPWDEPKAVVDAKAAEFKALFPNI